MKSLINNIQILKLLWHLYISQVYIRNKDSVGLAEGQVFCNPPHLTQQKIVNILINSKIPKMPQTSPLPVRYGGGGGDQLYRRRVVWDRVQCPEECLSRNFPDNSLVFSAGLSRNLSVLHCEEKVYGVRDSEWRCFLLYCRMQQTFAGAEAREIIWLPTTGWLRKKSSSLNQ